MKRTAVLLCLCAFVGSITLDIATATDRKPTAKSAAAKKAEAVKQQRANDAKKRAEAAARKREEATKKAEELKKRQAEVAKKRAEEEAKKKAEAAKKAAEENAKKDAAAALARRRTKLTRIVAGVHLEEKQIKRIEDLQAKLARDSRSHADRITTARAELTKLQAKFGEDVLDSLSKSQRRDVEKRKARDAKAKAVRAKQVRANNDDNSEQHESNAMTPVESLNQTVVQLLDPFGILGLR